MRLSMPPVTSVIGMIGKGRVVACAQAAFDQGSKAAEPAAAKKSRLFKWFSVLCRGIDLVPAGGGRIEVSLPAPLMTQTASRLPARCREHYQFVMLAWVMTIVAGKRTVSALVQPAECNSNFQTRFVIA